MLLTLITYHHKFLGILSKNNIFWEILVFRNTERRQWLPR